MRKPVPVTGTVKAGRAALLLEAADGAAGGRGKIVALGAGLPVVDVLRAEELGLAFGREHVVHAAVAAGAFVERLETDAHGIPTGARTPFAACSGTLDDRVLDDGFASPAPPRLEVSGGGRRVAVELGPGYEFTQVFAPASPAVVALEPMTAPTNALASGEGLRLVEPGARFAASFRIAIS